MKDRLCHLEGEARLRRRLHYCGTCKTIGRMYGQRSRFFLNNDTVFLAELLSSISGESEPVRTWGPAYRSYNCLSLPRQEDDMPLPLKVAATATLVLTEFKIKDHISDSGGSAIKLAHRYYSKRFLDASSLLDAWGFPLDRLRDCLDSQSEREATIADGDFTGSPEDALRYVTEPTATASALFFEYGTRLVGREDASRLTYQVGFAFGSLVYLLDAFEDYEKDFKKGEFNAIKQAFRLSGARIDASTRQAVRDLLWRLEEEVRTGLFELPIPESYARLFASRLRSNLSLRLAVRLPVAQAQCACSQRDAELKGLRARIRSAVSVAKSIGNESPGAQSHSILSTLAAPFLFALAIAIALMFPNQTREATSYRQCFGVLFNLMFVSAFLRSIVSTPLRFAFPPGSQPPGPPPGGYPPPQGPLPPHAPTGSEYEQLPPSVPPPGGPAPKRGCAVCCCDSDCCDCGECCCDAGDCCNCCDCS